MTQKESRNQINEDRKKRKSQQLRSYKALLSRIDGLMREFPEDKALQVISGIMSSRIRELIDHRGMVVYAARDGFNEFVSRGVMPAIAPRQLLAVCIAKELWPKRSPYQAAAEQMGHAGENPDVLDHRIRALEKQVFRLLAQPQRYPVWGGELTADPYTLLRQELFDFKIWKENQQPQPDMSIEEFDAHFNEYLDRIYPTPEEEQLLRVLLDKFLEGTRSRSRKANAMR